MDPYIGEIRLFAGTFAPMGWHFCDGSLLSISENEALFTLIGTTYGGDGQSTFALPDLRGRAVVNQQATTYPLGTKGGVENVTLTSANMPVHNHNVVVSGDAGTSPSPQNNFLAAPTDSTNNKIVVEYLPNTTTNLVVQPLLPGTLSASGNSLPHSNMQPFVSINYIISLEGIFPSQN